jgi:DNA topoisomerase VI subunit B
MRKTGEKLKISYNVGLMENRKPVKSQKIDSQTRLELVLDTEREIFLLLVISLLDEEKELEPIEMKDDEEEARRLFDAIVVMGALSPSPTWMRAIANNKVLKDIFGIESAVTVLPRR